MSKIEVNAIEPQCGTTLTIGASDTSIAGIGTVNWDTTKKTASFTAVSGRGYFVDTTSGAITMTLPASPSVGDIVAFKDYASKFSTNNLTIGRNSSNLDGNAGDKTIDTNNISMSLIYVDATQGWKSIEEGTGFIGESFIVASGGTETTCGDYKIHKFTSPGTFTVCSVATVSANNTVSYLVVAGGGGGGGGNQNPGDYEGGGGGAGGMREYKGPADCYTASPLNGNPGGTAITVTATAFPITVGAGGAFASSPLCTTPGTKGSNSVFSTITSTGGGGGGSRNTPSGPANGGQPGGSGGGGGQADNPTHQTYYGAGNTPPVTPSQGNRGGSGNLNPNTPTASGGGGGGGATAIGGDSPVPAPDNIGGAGGAGGTTSITGSPVAYGGGGGGSGYNCAGSGGTGGGGTGSTFPSVAGTSGTANTGGGGGGGGSGNNHPTATPGGGGGSGIVIIRYKFQ